MSARVGCSPARRPDRLPPTEQDTPGHLAGGGEHDTEPCRSERRFDVAFGEGLDGEKYQRNPEEIQHPDDEGSGKPVGDKTLTLGREERLEVEDRRRSPLAAATQPIRCRLAAP